MENQRIKCLGSFIVPVHFNSTIVYDSNIVGSNCLQKETHKLHAEAGSSQDA